MIYAAYMKLHAFWVFMVEVEHLAPITVVLFTVCSALPVVFFFWFTITISWEIYRAVSKKLKEKS